MIFAIDFDDTIVSQRNRDYDDVTTPLVFMPGAKEALIWLKRAGHTLVLYSGRANRALRIDPELNPLVRIGIKRYNKERWPVTKAVNEARYQQMIEFVNTMLPGIFDAIDDGQQGKPSADFYIDDKALRYGPGADARSWADIAQVWGEPVYGEQLAEETL